MRDIRADLRERLQAIARDRAGLDQMEAGIKELLRIEDRREFIASGNGNGTHVDEGGTPLKRFILTVLRHSKQPLTVGDLKVAAAQGGYDFGEKSPGRVLHWALVGMAQGGIVEKKEDNKWHLKEDRK